MCDFCEKYANVSGKHGTIRLGAENYMLFANSENEPMGAINIIHNFRANCRGACNRNQ